MAKKHTPDAMVDGMFMGASLLKNLLDLIIERGGFPEQLHYLTTPQQGQENLKRVADCIIESPWRKPRSLMEELSAKKSLEDGIGDPDSYRYHYWEYAAEELGIPTITFRDAGNHMDDRCGCTFDLAPLEILDQLQGKRLERRTLTVTWDAKEYVVMGMSMNGKLGNVFDPKRFDHLIIAPIEYFDMTR